MVILQLPIPNPLQNHIVNISFYKLTQNEMLRRKILPENITSLFVFLNPTIHLKEYFSNGIINYRVAYAGPYSKPRLYEVEEDICFIKIDFFPWGVFSAFGLEQYKLHNTTIDAYKLFPKLKLYSKQLEASLDNIETCIAILEQFMLEDYHEYLTPTDEKIITACNLIKSKDKNLPIKELCRLVNMSQYSFCNHFTKIIGISPKLFGQIARYSKAKKLIHSTIDINWNEIAFQFGYFDQSHFIKEYKRFSGAIPKEYKNWKNFYI